MKKKKLNITGEYALELTLIYDALTEIISGGAEITMGKIEESFREAALSCGRIAPSDFLSEMSEEIPICSKYGEKMINLGRLDSVYTRMKLIHKNVQQT